MKALKKQQMFHLTIDGKKTVCGLSNQYKDADNIEKFNKHLNNGLSKFCCIKCQSKK